MSEFKRHPDPVSNLYRESIAKVLRENWVSMWGAFDDGLFDVHQRGKRVDRVPATRLFSSILTEYDGSKHRLYATPIEGMLQVGMYESVLEDAKRKRTKLTNPLFTIDPGNVRYVRRLSRVLVEQSGCVYLEGDTSKLPIEVRENRKALDQLMGEVAEGKQVEEMKECLFIQVPDDYQGKLLTVVDFEWYIIQGEFYFDAAVLDTMTGELVPKRFINKDGFAEWIRRLRPDAHSNILGNL